MDLGDRMKAYEEAFKQTLTPRMPAVIRLDGKAFHTLTRGCERPFDAKLRDALVEATKALMDEVPGRMAYHQSDEVSILLVDYNRFESQQWFVGQVQKMVSVAASIMGVEFSSRWTKPGYFDARVCTIPERDIENYFVWRQKDAMRNAVSMAAQAHFSANELHEKSTIMKLEMLTSRGIAFSDYPGWFRLGSVITRADIVDAPVFSANPDFLKNYLTVEES